MSGMVFDPRGEGRALDSLLAKGGEAEIYPVSGRPDVLCKKYHQKELEKRGKDLRNKIHAMHELRNEILKKHSGSQDFQNLSWPVMEIFDQHKNWLGYCMYRGTGETMFKMAHAVLYKKHFPDLNRKKIVKYLLNFLKQVKKLHRNKIMIGDYNLQNILLDPNGDKVTLIDCDSYQIEFAGKRYPCEVGSADMTAKEHQNKHFKDVIRTPQSEYFSIAIILFKALMLGRHPYDIVGGTDPVQNLCSGKFPYGADGRGIPKGAWYNIWSHMPYQLKNLFIKTFTEGANDPNKRATIDEWLDSLKIYLREMEKGWHEIEIRPEKPKEKIYRGNQNL